MLQRVPPGLVLCLAVPGRPGQECLVQGPKPWITVNRFKVPPGSCAHGNCLAVLLVCTRPQEP